MYRLSYYPADCDGCKEIKGKVFWLAYTGEDVFDIYECCVKSKKLGHCGMCEKFPCG